MAPLLWGILMGTTDWSDWSDQKGRSFLCTYQDLTKEGQALYDQIKALYGESCQLYLQTWLDT